MPIREAPSIEIRPAAWPADQGVSEALLRGYAAHLAKGLHTGAGICLTNFEQELAEAATRWSLPRGVLLLAFVDGEPCGCVGLKLLPEPHSDACELKRLWVEPGARGLGLGRALVEVAADWCCRQGRPTMLLDTVPAAMPEAVSLYRAVGFQETERYNANDVPGILFMERQLDCPEVK